MDLFGGLFSKKKPARKVASREQATMFWKKIIPSGDTFIIDTLSEYFFIHYADDQEPNESWAFMDDVNITIDGDKKPVAYVTHITHEKYGKSIATLALELWPVDPKAMMHVVLMLMSVRAHWYKLGDKTIRELANNHMAMEEGLFSGGPGYITVEDMSDMSSQYVFHLKTREDRDPFNYLSAAVDGYKVIHREEKRLPDSIPVLHGAFPRVLSRIRIPNWGDISGLVEELHLIWGYEANSERITTIHYSEDNGFCFESQDGTMDVVKQKLEVDHSVYIQITDLFKMLEDNPGTAFHYNRLESHDKFTVLSVDKYDNLLINNGKQIIEQIRVTLNEKAKAAFIVTYSGEKHPLLKILTVAEVEGDKAHYVDKVVIFKNQKEEVLNLNQIMNVEFYEIIEKAD